MFTEHVGEVLGEVANSRNSAHLAGVARLVQAVQDLSLARNLAAVVDVTRHAARDLVGAEGSTFVLRDQDQCYYVDEDAIEPLWKGKRFPLESCVSGWAMLNREPVVIEDVYADERVPTAAYRPTFVKSLVMVPIRTESPIGAIGNYWAQEHRAEAWEVALLQSLAHSTSVALENVQLYADLQGALRASESVAQELSRQLALRDDFISVAAHELRTPLTPLLIQAQFLERLSATEGFDPDRLRSELRRSSEVSRRQVSALSHLVNDLLDVSRLQLGKFRFDFAEGDLATAVVDTVDSVRTLSVAPIRLKVEGEFVGRWDIPRMKQMLRHLLLNAITYGESKPIDVELDVVDGRARLSVQDAGIGVAPEDQERIFQRFERASSIKRFGGMGVGLYLARAVVEGHGGSLGLRSALGEGATFVAKLPIRPALAS